MWLFHGRSSSIQSNGTPQVLVSIGILAGVALDLVMEHLATDILAGDHQGNLQWD
jgi:hypothetical protein